MNRAIRDVLFPALILLPSNVSGYSSKAIFNGKEYAVEISESRKVAQMRSEKSIEKRILSLSMINHQKSILELKLEELNYEIFELAKGTISNSKDLSSRIKSIGDIFNAPVKIPWEALALKSLDAKIFACAEVWPKMTEARDYLYSMEDFELNDQKSMNKVYSSLRDLTRSIDSSVNLINRTRESTEVRFIITEKEVSDLKKSLRYWNLNDIEELSKRIKSRFYKSKEYAEYSKSINHDNVDLENIVESYEIISSDNKRLFEKSYPVFLSSNSQFDSPLKTEARIRLERILEKGEEYNLNISVELDKTERSWTETFVFNKAKSSLFIFYPQECNIGASEQAQYFLKARGEVLAGRFSEVFPYGKDKKIVMELKGSEYSLKKAISFVSPGNITRVGNVMDWVSKKILEYESSKKEEQKKNVMERLTEDYSVKEIPFYPSKNQISAHFFSIPVENQGKPIYALLNLGVQDWQQKHIGNIENILIEINPEAAVESKEEMIIPLSWIERINSVYKTDNSILRSAVGENSPDRLYGTLIGVVNQIVGNEKKPEYSKEVLMRAMNSEILKIKRKNYGWIVSEPFIKVRGMGLFEVLNSFEKDEYSALNVENDIPNKVKSAIKVDVADFDYIKQARLEKIGNAYCSLKLNRSDHSYDCFLPALFDETGFHIEFRNNINEIKSLGVSPIDNMYLLTEMGFDKPSMP